MTPVCPFTVYKKLADELDLCTKRINAIMKGLKVRGIILGSAEDIKRLADAGDNELIPVSDVEQIVQTAGLEKAIAWWPIQQAIAVLQQLYQQRGEIKAAIYEITGISDIVRGASNANETLGAQQIKTQWGSLRIQKMQRMIERLVRDIFGMMADIIITKFSPETLQEMTGIEITPDIMQLMSQPVSSSYRVDVESDSTVKADMSRIKGEMSEFLQGTAQFFNVMARSSVRPLKWLNLCQKSMHRSRAPSTLASRPRTRLTVCRRVRRTPRSKTSPIRHRKPRRRSLSLRPKSWN
ncbi:hypothetical protein ACQT3V_13095 [Brucella sp. NF 2653]|uniref:hypothetical protein n=1 Tax=Brucella sp. NF 2653 TaxID=693748 RepID=UPI003D0F44AE